MSRSYRHTPICGITCTESEKRDKQHQNRATRRRVRVLLLVSRDPDVPPKRPRVYLSKDGKQRFDPARWPELLRK